MTGSAEKTVMPEDIADKGKKVFGEEETVEGVRVGIHWFEVMKVNKIQLECIKILSKELRRSSYSDSGSQTLARA
ncbi:hypothetical protein C356_04433 [Cryptococcus neoformans c45]|nr:hypothetical protein C356_04433 [Cryptococcus neoformans var. grubii c45]